jgi:hypothetical protein
VFPLLITTISITTMPSPVFTVATISTTHISSHRVPTLHSYHFATATIYNIDFIAFTLPCSHYY